MVKKISLIMLAVYALITAYILIDIGSGFKVDEPLFDLLISISATLFFWLWVVSPQIFFYKAISPEANSSIKALYIFLQGCFFALSLLIYYNKFYDYKEPDAQGGLLLIFIPLWQNIFILGLSIIIKVVRYLRSWLANRKQNAG